MKYFLITAISLSLLSCTGFLLLATFVNPYVQHRTEEINSLREILRRAQLLSSKEAQLQREIAELEEKIEQLEDILPKETILTLHQTHPEHHCVKAKIANRVIHH